jgi:uncharacterized protein
MSRTLGLIVKATRLCNLRCTYCHDWREGPGQSMPFEVLARMTAAALADGEAEAVSFLWHGGEPLVLPRAFYDKALVLQAHLRRAGQRVTNAVQTNGTLIDAEWAAFLRDHEFGVSLSLDGPRVLHDRRRVYVSGKGSYRDVVRGINILRAHRVPMSALMVIDEKALALGAERIFDLFVELGIARFGLLASTPSNAPGASSRGYVDPARMNAFLIRMYDAWREHGDPAVQIREIDAIRRRIHGERAGLCTLAGDCFGRYFAVDPNGDVAHCDVFSGDVRYTIGNVTRQSFAELRTSAALHALRAEDEDLAEAHDACPEAPVCNGGCPHERYLAVRHEPGPRAGCCGRRALIEHVRAHEAAATAP